jgi:hypothetical protein
MWFKDPNHLPQSSYYRPLSNVWWGVTTGGAGSRGLSFNAIRQFARNDEPALCLHARRR